MSVKKALIVDDENHICTAFARILRECGVEEIDECGNGSEAIEKVGLSSPDLVLLDINMPGISGLDALETITARSPAPRVVIISAMATKRTVEQCLAAGAAAYLRKDLPLAEIRSRIAAIVSENEF